MLPWDDSWRIPDLESFSKTKQFVAKLSNLRMDAQAADGNEHPVRRLRLDVSFRCDSQSPRPLYSFFTVSSITRGKCAYSN